MLLIPAIDLKDGQCVRLKLGDMNQATVFNDDPAAQATLTTSRDWLLAADRDLTGMLGAGRSALLDYDHWAARPQAVIDAFARLGLPRDDDAVRAALGTPLDHGPHARSGG